ncbi:MAG TPA: heparinase II/III family protein, partial [Lacunisphaera sp.]
TAPDVEPNVFLAGGQAILRKRWADPNAGQRYLLFHGVAVADNHNHDDQLSFLIEAEGQMMCSDGGYSRGTYEGAERTAWYNKAPAHNTLTFDGQPAGKNPSNVTPESQHWEQPGLVVVSKTTNDLPKKGTWRRTICWIGEDYYAVIDQVLAKNIGEIKAYLHGGRGTLTTSGGERTWNYSADRYGPAAKLRSWIAAPGATTVVKEGELTYIKGDYAAFPYLETTAQPGRSIITLLKPTAANESAAFSVEDRSTKDCSAFVITTAGEKTVIAAPQSGSVKIDGVETDAPLVIVRRDSSGKVLNHFTADAGTYLRIDGHDFTRP